jgi:hypothetical protein
VTLGVTLTYNLYFDDDWRPVSSKESVSEYLSLPPATNERAFRETFQGLLENPEFLPNGGTLAFGVRHHYPLPEDDDADYPDSLRPIYGALKGSDAVVYQVTLVLRFQPALYLDYKNYSHQSFSEATVIDTVIDLRRLDCWKDRVTNVASIVLAHGGIAVYSDSEGRTGLHVEPEMVEWVTPMTTLNCESAALIQ